MPKRLTEFIGLAFVAVSLLGLVACSDTAPQGSHAFLRHLQVVQIHAKDTGVTYHYCDRCVHFTSLK